MIDIDPQPWKVPLFVAVGLVISQLFIYGKKVKKRVKITAAELAGDIMQFGVRMVITIASIRGIEFVTKHSMEDVWQVVATTIVICTSFDNYFIRLRELVLTRLVGAAGVLFGRMPDDAMIELDATDRDGPMKVTTVKNIDKIGDAGTKVGLPLRKVFLPDGKDHEDQRDTVDLLGKLDDPNYRYGDQE